MLIFVATIIGVSIIISVGRSLANRRSVQDTLSKPPEYKASFLLSKSVVEGMDQVEKALATGDFGIVSKDQNSFIINDNKITTSGPAYTTQPGDVVYKIDFISQSSGQTVINLSASEKSRFLSAGAITIERFSALKNQIAQALNISAPKVDDLTIPKSMEARAGDFLLVLLIAIIVIGGLILAAYLLYGRS